MILTFALISSKARRTRARVTVQTFQRASATVHARAGVARVGHGDLAQRGRVADRARTLEAGRGVGRGSDVTCAAILTARPGACVARVEMLTVLAHELGGAVAVRFAFQCGHTLASIFTWIRIARYKTRSRSHQENKDEREKR